MEWRKSIGTFGSSRSTDRIRGMKLLNRLLDSNEHIKELKTAEETKKVSMNEVFQSFHKVLVKEAWRVRDKQGRVAAATSSAATMNTELKKLFSKILIKSREDVLRISAENMMNSLNEIFRSIYLREEFGGSYFVRITSVLLKRRTYWGELTASNWKDLMTISIIAYNENLIGADKSRVSKTIAYIIAQGSLNSDLPLWITSKVNFIFDVVMRTDCAVTHVAECHLLLGLSFTAKIAKENRKLVCQFGEGIIDMVLACYNPLVTEMNTLKCIVLEILILQLKVHHPNGVTMESPCAYAHDSQKWKSSIVKMNSLMQEEVTQMKTKIPNISVKEAILGRFLEFAVEISKQIMDISVVETDETLDSSISNESGFKRMLIFLQNLPEQSTWAWLYILSAVIKKYDCIDDCTYILLLNYLRNFISSSRDILTLDCYFRCCCSLAEVQVPDKCDILDYTTPWEIICDKAIWAIGLNQSEASAHEFIRCFFNRKFMNIKKKVQDVINLYLKDHIPLSEESIKTLYHLLMHCHVIDSMEMRTRQLCMKWIFPIKESIQAFQGVLPVKLVADILVQLCLKQDINKVPPKRSIINVGSLEHFYSMMNFNSGILNYQLNEPRDPEFTIHDGIFMEKGSFNILKCMVTQSGRGIVSCVNEVLASGAEQEERHDFAEFMCALLQLIALISSNFITFRVCIPTSEEISSLMNTFKTVLENLTDLLEAISKSQQALNSLTATFSSLLALYEFDLHHFIANFIREITPRKLMKIIMAVITERAGAVKGAYPQYIRSLPGKTFLRCTSLNFADYHSILDSNIFSDSNSLITIGCKMMGAFSCKNGPYNPQQIELITYFLEELPTKMKEIVFPISFQMLMNYLYLPIKRLAISNYFLKLTLSKLETIMMDHANDAEILQIFLSVLEGVASKADINPSVKIIVINASEFYLKKLHKRILERQVPLAISVKVFQLLGCLLKINPKITWTWLLNADRNQITISDLVLHGLDSPYAEVRMVIAENLCPILHPFRHGCDAEQKSTLNIWMKYITNCCPLDESITGVEHKENHLKVGIHCLSLIAVTCPSLTKQALFFLLILMNNQYIDRGLGRRIFDMIGKKLQADGKLVMREYLLDLIDKWLPLNDIKDYPFWLIYESIEEFYLDNAGILFSSLWLANHEELYNFCNISRKSIHQMLEEHSALSIALAMSQFLQSENVEDLTKNKAISVIDEIYKAHPDINLYEFLSKDNNSILYYAFRNMHDEQQISSVAGDSIFINCCHKLCYPERSSYYSTIDMNYKIFDQLYMWNKGANGVRYMNYLLGELPSHIRRVLFQLAHDVIYSQMSCTAISAMVALQTYVEYLMGFMPLVIRIREKMNSVSLTTGLVRDASFLMIKIMRKWSYAENDTVFTLCFLFLQKNLLGQFSLALKGRNVVLVPIVYALVDMVNEGCLKFLEGRVLNLIKILLKLESLKEDLYYLVPFPRTEKFEDLNIVLNQMAGDRTKTSLKDDLTDFVEAHDIFGFTRVEMLQLIQAMLKNKKEDLKDLYTDIEVKSDAYEIYGSCILHRAISLLFKLVTTSDDKIKIESAKCLAELQPSNLRLTALVPMTTVSNAKAVLRNQLHKLTFKCLEILPRYLLDSSMEVVEATSTALMAIMKSAEGNITLREDTPTQLKLVEDYTIQEKFFPIHIPIASLVFNKAAFSKMDHLWIPLEDQNHSEWIMAFVAALIQCFTSQSSYLDKLKRICSLKVSVCEELLPFVLEIFMQYGDIPCQLLLFEKIRSFFEIAYDSFSGKTKSNTPHGRKIKNKAMVITMINAINYLNLQHHGIQIRSGSQEKESIDLLHCALAAQHCSAYCSAIQYCALWLSNVSKGNEPNSIFFHIKTGTPHVEEILSILKESYVGLGDTDGVYGCGTSHLLAPLGRVEHFKHLEKWPEVMRAYELEVSNTSDRSAIEGLLISLKMLGMEELLMGLLDTQDEPDFMKYQYECSWRLCSWDLLSAFSDRKKIPSAISLIESNQNVEASHISNEETISLEFNRNLFFALYSIRNGKFTESLQQLDSARANVIDLLSIVSVEGYKNMEKPLSQFRVIKEVEEFAKAFQLSQESALTNILYQWEKFDFIKEKSFKCLEPVKALRLSLLKGFIFENKSHVSALNIGEAAVLAMAKIQLQLGCSAREVGAYEISEKYLREVRELPGLNKKPLLLSQLQLEEAQLQWAKGNTDIAKIIIASILKDVDPTLMDKNLARCHAEALTVLGHWVMKTQSENPKDVLSKYFVHAGDLMNEYMVDKASKEYLNSVRAVAEYANEQYITISKYIDSKSFSRKEKGVSDARYIVSDYECARNISLDEKRSIAIFTRQAKIDEKELKQCETDKYSYLKISLDYYIRYLKFSPNIDIPCAFRFVSLFLDIKSADELISEEVDSIPSYKFINVIPQLIPRIVQSKGHRSRILKSLVEKCAISHPHHVLPYILALAYSLKDLDRADDSDAFMTETQKENQLAAQKMLSKLRKIPSLTEHVKELSELWEALISLSYLKVNLNQCEVSLDENIQLTKLKDLSHVQVSTVQLAISPTGIYNDIISIYKYVPKFTLVGGINMPKRITCVGTDGKNYRQLLKSQDDLRQDAVMQQVFQLINFFLNKDQNAQKRKLRIRTYKVVPLSHRSGIIEWCANSTAIGTYLQGTKKAVGAHATFNPSDYSLNNCKDMLKNVQKEPKHIKLQVFLEICDNLRPVFRHYFFSKFPNPAVWYEKIQSYTRSVATSSMIGYVLGLGDRHLQNILIDAVTAEVLHVDLGIAFEQGKTISSPETVPFRLTRDIVDGMGVSGVEGVFRKSCEVTMALMRKHREIILAVLEVLIYDPLFAWTLKPRYKMKETDLESSNVLISQQSDNADVATALPEEKKSSSLPSAMEPTVHPADVSTSKISAKDFKSICDKTSIASTEASTQIAEQNATAIRALARLEQKLLGTEDGTPASSVEAQVEKLIQEAQDAKNLCLLYPGWQPYL